MTAPHKPMFTPASPNFWVQMAEADKWLDAELKKYEAEGYVQIPGTLIWEKRGANGKLVASLSL